jgi:hypothetical protein
MMIDYQSQCNIHVYVVDGLKRMLLLLNLERVVGGGTVDNLVTLIFKSLMEYGTS